MRGYTTVRCQAVAGQLVVPFSLRSLAHVDQRVAVQGFKIDNAAESQDFDAIIHSSRCGKADWLRAALGRSVHLRAADLLREVRCRENTTRGSTDAVAAVHSHSAALAAAHTHHTHQVRPLPAHTCR